MDRPCRLYLEPSESDHTQCRYQPQWCIYIEYCGQWLYDIKQYPVAGRLQSIHYQPRWNRRPDTCAGKRFPQQYFPRYYHGGLDLPNQQCEAYPGCDEQINAYQ